VGDPLGLTFPAACGCFFELFEQSGAGALEARLGVDVRAGELALFAGPLSGWRGDETAASAQIGWVRLPGRDQMRSRYGRQ
jgi:hypothetical protein